MVEGRTGFELYRQVDKAVDEIPENARFLTGADISDLVHKYGDKVKNLKTLYGFRLVLKNRAAEYKIQAPPPPERGRSGSGAHARRPQLLSQL